MNIEEKLIKIFREEAKGEENIMGRYIEAMEEEESMRS